jgi:hypothetical protein
VACDIIAPDLQKGRTPVNSRHLQNLAAKLKLSRNVPAVPAEWIKPPAGFLRFVAYQVSSMTRARSATPAQLVEAFGEIGGELTSVRRRVLPELRPRLHDLEIICRAIAPAPARGWRKSFRLIEQALSREASRPPALSGVAELRRVIARLRRDHYAQTPWLL